MISIPFFSSPKKEQNDINFNISIARRTKWVELGTHGTREPEKSVLMQSFVQYYSVTLQNTKLLENVHK